MLTIKLHTHLVGSISSAVKNILLSCLLCIMALPIHAARPSTGDCYPIREGWFAGTHIGTQYYVSEFKFRKSADLGYGFSSNFSAYGGKWLTPLFALRANLELNNVTSGSTSTNELNQPTVDKEMFHLLHTEAGLIIDGSYLLKKEKKKYSLNPIISIGCAINTTKKESGMTFSIGCINTWKVSPHLNLNIETRFRFLEDNINGYEDKCDGEFILNAGCAYSF